MVTSGILAFAAATLAGTFFPLGDLTAAGTSSSSSFSLPTRRSWVH